MMQLGFSLLSKGVQSSRKPSGHLLVTAEGVQSSAAFGHYLCRNFITAV
jgi:hypothetical protein